MRDPEEPKMTSEPTAVPPPPKPPSAFWKWTKRIGCVLILATFTCCGLTCTGGWWLIHLPYSMNKVEVDQLFAEGMHAGDVKDMHERADPKFRKRVTLAELQDFLDARPGVLERPNLHGEFFRKRNINGVEYVKVKSKPSIFSMDEWEIVFKIVDGVLVLVGISPGLDEDVPESFRYRRPSSGRRWFD